MTHLDLRGALAAAGILVVLASNVRADDPPSSGAPAAAPGVTPSEPVTLAIVNGDSITTAMLDSAIMAMHATEDMTRQGDFDFSRLLTKAINDRLLVQQALATELDLDERVVGPVQDRRQRNAVRAYVRATWTPPDPVAEAAVRERFERYFWKIQLSQLSVDTEAEARELRDMLVRGASWDSLAVERSRDSFRYRGGRHQLKPWADVETVVKDAVAGLDTGDISEPFPYNTLHSIVRVDERHPIDEDEYESISPGIRKYLESESGKARWTAYVDEHRTRFPVTRSTPVLERVAADSGRVLLGEFRRGSDDVALGFENGEGVTETELRAAVAHQALADSRIPFATHLRATIDDLTEDLVLARAAEEAGFMDVPEIVELYERDLEQALIESYLQETVASKIVFNRQEFQEYYESHQDDFREGDEVQLATITTDFEEEAREIAARLRDGADFSYVERQYVSSETEGLQSEPRWVSESLFSDAIRDEIARLPVGGTSDALDVDHGWLVFKVLGKRPGRVKALDDVEMPIRQVMFRRKFNEALDRHLDLLRERSEIVIDEAAITAYLGDKS